MKTNRFPHYDSSDNPTGCCPRFKPEGWNLQELHFEDKPFVRVTTHELRGGRGGIAGRSAGTGLGSQNQQRGGLR